MTPNQALHLRQALAMAGAIAAMGTAVAVAPTVRTVTSERAKDIANTATETVGPYAEEARATIEQALEEADTSINNGDQALEDLLMSRNAALLAVPALFAFGAFRAGQARGERLAQTRSDLRELEAFRPEISAVYQSGSSEPRWDLSLTNSTGQPVANVSARVRAMVEISNVEAKRRFVTKEGWVAMGALEADESRSVTVDAPDLTKSRSFGQRAEDFLSLPVDAEKPERTVNVEVVGWAVTLESGQQMMVDQSNPRRPTILQSNGQVIANGSSSGLSQL